MDPLRSDRPSSEAPAGAERDARIEQLLLSGLDHYFAANYEQAINLWTRVLFLDRHHDRARAYIERARSAQAERHREAEALLHQGMTAFEEGDVERARDLVGDALARGASRDIALGVLDRIQRLEAGHAAPRPRHAAVARPLREHETRTSAPAAGPGRGRGWAAAALLALAAFGALAVGVWGVTLPDPWTWPIFAAASSQRQVAALPVSGGPLPVVNAADTYFERARGLYGTGHLRDALRELDRIPVGDRLHAEAQRLQAEIQRDLLALAVAELEHADPPAAAASGPPPPE